MKLYLVKCRGMKDSFVGINYGFAYAVADNSDEAYKMVREYLDKHGIGYRDERELYSIKLLADEETYPDCRVRLYVAKHKKEDEK